jgi:hypothetical protein
MAWIRRYWATALVWLSALGFMVVALLRWRSSAEPKIGRILAEAKQAAEEARHAAVVEASAARRKEAALRQRLRDIQTIQDGAVRRQELLKLYSEVQ